MEAAGSAPEQLSAVGGGSGLVAADARWNAPAETLVPDLGARAGYDELDRVYRSLYPATREQAHAIARVQEETASAARS